MNIIQFYEDFNILYAPEGHRHYRYGWINTECPFCSGNPGMHLGWNLDNDYFFCWRCESHSIEATIARLLKVNIKEAKRIQKQYAGKTKPVKEIKRKIRLKAHKLPSGATFLTNRHKQYLEQRGFDPAYLIQEWNLLGTGPVSFLDNISYKHRIIAPIFWGGDQVSFQGRDITNKHKLKYLTCPADRELIHHKHILYGKQNAWGNTGICVEGIVDVWRFGVNAFATLGIQYTNFQIRIMANTFKRIAVVFDSDPQAKRQANKLVAELLFRGVGAWRVDIEGDPGGMKQEDADYLIKTILK